MKVFLSRCAGFFVVQPLPGAMFLVLTCLFAITNMAVAGAPLVGPVNSDPLTARGISPRILDVAIVPMSQGLRYESKVTYQQTLADGSSGMERFRMIFDPDTDYGRDLYIELESEPLRSARGYRRMLEVTMGADHWLREQDRIHDANSIRLLSAEAGREVVEFRYAAARIPTSLQWLTSLTGQVIIEDGKLDRIELVGDGRFQRDGISHENYTMTVYFGEVEDIGGHVISAIKENFRARINRRWVDATVWSRMLAYSSADYGDISWIDPDIPPISPIESETLAAPSEAVAAIQGDALEQLPVIGDILDENIQSADIIRLNLQRKLPFYADEVRKLGFELPKTYGLGFAGHYQRQDIDMQGFTVQGIDVTKDLPLIDPFGSEVESEIFTGQLRADMWVLPFLNVSLLVGEMERQHPHIHPTPIINHNNTKLTQTILNKNKIYNQLTTQN